MMHRPSRTIVLTALLASGTLALTACGGSNFDAKPAASGTAAGPGSDLSILIGSSGAAETDAVNAAVAAWSKDSGTKATVSAASDLVQQLSQGFAGGKPADVFYLDTGTFAGYAANGSLLPYAGDLANADDFYPTLKDSFTFDGTFTCAPKDFSTLALIINTAAWTAAGLTDADIPTTWDQLKTVSAKLTTATQVGLTFGPQYERIGAFFPQAGGAMTSKDGAKATVNSPENLEALTYVKGLLTDGVLKYPKDLGAGWGGEAFGTEKAAMTIEGNWITGALKKDYPTLQYKVVELPAGPAAKGTMQFTNCWGIAADSTNTEAAKKLVEALTSSDQQMAFADAFGVMPSVQSAAADWKVKYPEQAAFLDSADFAVGVVNAQGAADVIADFNAKLEALSSSEPKTILDAVQTNLQTVLDAKS
ncbi:extracellular solute-binding protein [Pengzhenrongella phosphoraccumulans]|uniref:sugar ABC transporter substrate-binding protein n=1 Tax=Pengzhenrongella phosphoraccumulans TaxID=3114394 RepID=UPI00388F1540